MYFFLDNNDCKKLGETHLCRLVLLKSIAGDKWFISTLPCIDWITPGFEKEFRMMSTGGVCFCVKGLKGVFRNLRWWPNSTLRVRVLLSLSVRRKSLLSLQWSSASNLIYMGHLAVTADFSFGNHIYHVLLSSHNDWYKTCLCVNLWKSGARCMRHQIKQTRPSAINTENLWNVLGKKAWKTSAHCLVKFPQCCDVSLQQGERNAT